MAFPQCLAPWCPIPDQSAPELLPLQARAVPVHVTASHPLGWVCWGRPAQPGGVLCRDTRAGIMRAGGRMGNSGAAIAPRLSEGENCGISCAGFASVVITAFRPKVATVPAIAFHCVPCTACSITDLQLQVLLTFVRTSYPLIAMSLTYGPGARWKDSKTNMTSVWLEKGPRSCRADMP